MTNRKIQVVTHPNEYFREITYKAAKDISNVYITEVLDYIANLLHHTLRINTQEGQIPIHASQQFVQELIASLKKSTQEQLKVSKHIGDFSLLLSGLFSDAVSKKILDLEYFIHMGQTGYQYAHHVSLDPEVSRLFLELSKQFVPYMEVLHRVAQLTGLINENNVLNIYEKWQHSQSPYLKKLLASHGIIFNTPDDSDKSNH